MPLTGRSLPSVSISTGERSARNAAPRARSKVMRMMNTRKGHMARGNDQVQKRTRRRDVQRNTGPVDDASLLRTCTWCLFPSRLRCMMSEERVELRADERRHREDDRWTSWATARPGALRQSLLTRTIARVCIGLAWWCARSRGGPREDDARPPVTMRTQLTFRLLLHPWSALTPTVFRSYSYNTRISTTHSIALVTRHLLHLPSLAEFPSPSLSNVDPLRGGAQRRHVGRRCQHGGGQTRTRGTAPRSTYANSAHEHTSRHTRGYSPFRSLGLSPFHTSATEHRPNPSHGIAPVAPFLHLSRRVICPFALRRCGRRCAPRRAHSARARGPSRKARGVPAVERRHRSAPPGLHSSPSPGSCSRVLLHYPRFLSLCSSLPRPPLCAVSSAGSSDQRGSAAAGGRRRCDGNQREGRR